MEERSTNQRGLGNSGRPFETEIMHMIARLLFFLLALPILSVNLLAQLVLLGSSSDDVAKSYGPALGYFWRGTIYQDYPATDEVVYFVYRQKDAINEYEYRISYYVDNTESNLHPTYRVATITMLTDQPVVIRQMLERLTWAKGFCYGGCDVRRLVPGNSIFLTRRGDKSFTAPTIQAFMNRPDGEPLDRRVHDLDSFATAFILSPYDYSTFPLMLSVKGGWFPHSQ